MWQDAASFAARAHAGQVRKDGRTPYVAHAFRVAMTVRDVFGCDDQVVITAALLHDTIEDTTTDYDDLLEAFGEEVACTVAAVTKNMALPEKAREAAYDEQLARADWRARLVKLADVYDNLRDTAAERPHKMAEMLAKCRRALALAKKDAAESEVTRRAVERVRGLVRAAEARGRGSPRPASRAGRSRARG
jgi:(p)ppGpp synthase/HD superfamily hydrolase